MKINALTQALSPRMQANKDECCSPAMSSVSLTGPKRDTVSFRMNPAAEVAEELGSPAKIQNLAKTIADELPRPKLPTEDLQISKVEDTNPFKKIVEDAKTPRIATVIPDEIAAKKAAELADLQKAAFMSANAGF